MRSVTIAKFRDRLTQYLREVRAGEEIILRDRKRRIAKIVPLTVQDGADETGLVAAGLLRKAQRPLSEISNPRLDCSVYECCCLETC